MAYNFNKKYWFYLIEDNQVDYYTSFFSDNKIISLENMFVTDLRNYGSRTDITKQLKLKNPDCNPTYISLSLWNLCREMNIGDIVFLGTKSNKIIARGVINSSYDFRENDKLHVRGCLWTWIDAANYDVRDKQNQLSDISQYLDYIKNLNALFGFFEDVPCVDKDCEAYTKKDFLDSVFISEKKYETIKNLLFRKKNIILQGAPGVGKTFMAKRLAYSIMGIEDSNRIEIIQFHQNYSYEDFIMGYRPSDIPNQQFVRRNGIFYNFCKKAESDLEHEYFFIIDEINRGNLSKIFGELLMLIENDKRNQNIRLLYSNELFSIPDNIYIIGMMNTADRSLAIIDYALRRRFAFIEIEPAFDSKQFNLLKSKINNEKYNNLIEAVKKLNLYISSDESLGRGYKIGHSYFCLRKKGDELEKIDDEWLEDLVEYELKPLLEEYWYDDLDECEQWCNILRQAIS